METEKKKQSNKETTKQKKHDTNQRNSYAMTTTDPIAV